MQNISRSRIARHAQLMTGLALAISLALPAGSSAGSRHAALLLPTVSHDVTSCEDNGDSGTLRAVINDPMTASGHTVNLASLPMSCSVITLGSEIVIAQSSLYLVGPADRIVTIDGDQHSRVFNHTGAGTIDLSELRIAHGQVEATVNEDGGCLRSMGSVVLRSSEVTGCRVSGQAQTRGGGVYTAADLTLSGSTIRGNESYSSAHGANGGGAYVRGHFAAKYSTVSDNTAERKSDFYVSNGGGLFVLSGASLLSSTVSGNVADKGGGLLLVGNVASTTDIVNSTFSANVATTDYAGGIFAKTPLAIRNSTIVFNRAPTKATGAGLHVENTQVTLESNIVSGNEGLSGEDDLGGIGNVGGSNNLVVASHGVAPPPNSLYACPKLQPLLVTGTTASHALAFDSPALNRGTNTATLTVDQRGLPRESAPQVDIGSTERQPGEVDERLLTAGFDGICDR